MMKRILWLVLVFLLVGLATVCATDVKVSTYILNLGKFDIATGSFTADFYLSLTCDEPGCTVGDFEFMNGRATVVDKIDDDPNNKFYRVQATLNSPVDLKDFPFDKQEMQIILEDKEKTTEELNYIVDKESSGVDKTVTFTGWQYDGWGANVETHEYEVYEEDYSRYKFTMNISRVVLNSFLKTFLPVIFIVLVVLSSFVLDPDKINNRLTMVGSSLVASVMFHVSIANQIPPVGYLTFADKFMILTYLVLLVSFVINIILLELQERKNVELVEKIHRRTEYAMFFIVPLLYIAWFFLFL